MNSDSEEKVGNNTEIKAGARLKVLFNSLFVSGSANLNSNYRSLHIKRKFHEDNDFKYDTIRFYEGCKGVGQ